MNENNPNIANNETKSQETVTQVEPSAGAERNTLMGILCYIGPLVLIPLITTKDDPFVKFHIRQGLVLAIITVAFWIIHGVFWIPGLNLLMNLVNLAVLILSIVGIMNVLKYKEQELPVVGQFAKHLIF